MYFHVVARTFGKAVPFATPQKAHWVWRHLKPAFPTALAAVLMPDHIHVVLKSDSPKKIQSTLAHLLGRFTFVFGEKPPFWQPIPEPSWIADHDKLRRNIRYVLLNPCRAQFCKDPLEWKWSTYRGSVGAVVDPWVNQPDFLAALGCTALPQAHRYITSDPSVAVLGTRPPIAAGPSEAPLRSLQEIEMAAYAATEDLVENHSLSIKNSPTRLAFVRLADHQGWQSPTVLAQHMRISYFTARELMQKQRNLDCAEAALCLGDARLLSICDASNRKKGMV